MLTLARMRQNMDLETYRADWLRLRERFVAEAADPDETGDAAPDRDENALDKAEEDAGIANDETLQHFGEFLETEGGAVAPTADPGSTAAPEETTAAPER